MGSRAHKADHSCSGGIVQKASAITDVCKTVAGNQGKQPHKAAFASHIMVVFSMGLPVALLQCSHLIVDVHVCFETKCRRGEKKKKKKKKWGGEKKKKKKKKK